MLVYMALAESISDREKLALIYEKHKNKMYSAAFAILGDSYLAEDAVHEAFVAIARNIGKLGNAEAPETSAYALRAAKTRAINILEKNRKEVFIDEDTEIPFDESEFERIVSESALSRIAECINRLPEKYRTVIVLRYLDEMKPKRIAELLGIKVETVKKRLHRGRAMLKNVLKEGGE